MVFGKQAIIDDLQHELAQERQKTEELERQVESARRVGHIATAVEAELEHVESMGFADVEAERMAQVSVFTTELGVIQQEKADELLQTKRSKYLTDLRREKGPAIKAELDEKFEADGAYDDVKASALDEVRQEVADGLIAEKREEIQSELSAPESQATIKAEVKAELASSPALEQYRENLLSTSRKVWTETVTAELESEIDAEVLAGEAEFKHRTKQELSDSPQFKKLREATKARLQKEWSAAGAAELTVAIEDEELISLLEEKAALEKEKLRKENYAKKLIADFEGLGIDVSDVTENTRLVVMLGEVGNVTVKEEYRDGYGYTKERDVTKKGIRCDRKLSFLSLGAGRFMIDGDSLQDSGSVYERNNALVQGTVVVLGRKVKDHGVEKLDQRLAADVPLYYDDDTTDPHISDALLCIADVQVNGISARGLDDVVMTGKTKK